MQSPVLWGLLRESELQLSQSQYKVWPDKEALALSPLCEAAGWDWRPWHLNHICFLLGVTNDTSSAPRGWAWWSWESFARGQPRGKPWPGFLLFLLFLPFFLFLLFSFFSSIPLLLISLGFYFCLTIPLEIAAFPKRLRVGSAWRALNKSHQELSPCMTFSQLSVFPRESNFCFVCFNYKFLIL